MIRLEDVSVRYGEVGALKQVDLAVEPGDLCVLVGPSGSGKSTLLRLVNRLVEPASGRVFVRGTDVRDVEPAQLRRSVGYVMQSIGLFPHRTVERNIATVPRLLGWSTERIAERVEAMMRLVHLPPEFRTRYPGELSGGQAQRVGLARALAADPDILLMDEPFGAVDPITRRELRTELRRIHAETGKTILFVTHDPAEALELATRIVVLREGRVQAVGAPDAFSPAQADDFVRHLFGIEALALNGLRLLYAGARVRTRALAGAPTISSETSLRDALVEMILTRSPVLTVTAADGSTGGLQVEDILEAQR
jgi:osmoprotectant transport system ATP-binding protein